VQFTHSVGQALPSAATKRNPQLAGKPFQAASISVIVHPRNPYAPTTHMNLRFFQVAPATSTDNAAEENRSKGQSRSGAAAPVLGADNTAESPADVWYFGGGFDLTPYYAFPKDCVHWHRVAQQAAGTQYEAFKAACDNYFYLPHRQEHRGIGGLFFDDWTQGGFDASLALVKAIGNAFLPAYRPIFKRRAPMRYGKRERDWQLYRRGRYAEFNLVIDRGTRYGLQSGRRVESVLASLPPLAAWRYDYRPAEGSPEAELVALLKDRHAWLLPVDKSGDKI